MELDQLLTEINTFADAPALVEGIKKKAKTIYQPIFNDGHSAATATHTEKQTKLQEQLDKAKSDLEDAKKEVKTLQEKQPDVATLHSDYGKKLSEKDGEIETLKKQIVTERRDVRRNEVIAKVRDGLSEIVIPEHAKALTDAESFKARVDFDEQDQPRLMQNGVKLPFAGSIDDQVKSIVEEMAKNIPAALRRSDVDSGSGRNGSRGGAAKQDVYKQIRDEAAARVTARTPIKDPMSELAKRTGQGAL